MESMDFLSLTLWSSLNSLHHTAINQHVQSRWPQVHIQGPLWHWDGRSLQAQMYAQVDTVLTIPHVYLINHSMWAVPHHGTPCCSSAYTHGTTVISKPTLNDIIIAPFIPTDPLFPPHLHPEDHIIGTGHHSSQEGNTLYQDRSQGSWPLLDHLLGGVTQKLSSQLKSTKV